MCYAKGHHAKGVGMHYPKLRTQPDNRTYENHCEIVSRIEARGAEHVPVGEKKGVKGTFLIF